MISTRMKLFRDYNGFSSENIANAIGIDTEQYLKYESGNESPTIDIIIKLAECYRVTVDEFYGYTPRLEVYQGNQDAAKGLEDRDEALNELLKFTDLTWDEKQLVLYYRRCNCNKREEIMKAILDGVEN